METGEPRYTKLKKIMKNKLNVEISSKLVDDKISMVVLMTVVCFILRYVDQKGGAVSDLIEAVQKFLIKYLHIVDLCLVFDRYYMTIA